MANPKFSKIYSLRTSDFDENEKLHPWSILDLFQDIAGLHAEMLGIGRSAFIKSGIVWVLVRTKYKIEKNPKVYDDVKVTTWPLSPKKLICQRDYLIESMDGEVLVRGTSDWVLMDVESRRMTTAEMLYPFDETEAVIRSLDGKLKKIRDFEPEEPGFSILPGYADIDVNGHVNNARYAMFAENALGGMDIESMQIDYLHEVRCGEELTLYKSADGNTITLKGTGADGERRFSALITTK